jgi:membrane-associated phospholipid phosphatase
MLSALTNRTNNLVILFICIAVIIIAFLGCVMFTNNASFLALTHFHSTQADEFFKLVTLAGDGLFALAVIGYCVVSTRYKLAAYLIVAFLFSGLICSILKDVFHAARPSATIALLHYVRPINDVTLHCCRSFPSGHTTTAFAMYVLLALQTKKFADAFLFLLVALLVAYSRIYLWQHFLFDVAAGALLGTLTAFCCYYFMITLSWQQKSIQLFNTRFSFPAQ